MFSNWAFRRDGSGPGSLIDLIVNGLQRALSQLDVVISTVRFDIGSLPCAHFKHNLQEDCLPVK